MGKKILGNVLWALVCLPMLVELLLLFFVVLSILLQFRKKLFMVVARLLSGVDQELDSAILKDDWADNSELRAAASNPAYHAWQLAISSGDLSKIRSLARNPETRGLTQDGVAGKFLFYFASDTPAPVFEVYLENVQVPVEFLHHSLPRLDSQKSCVAFRRVLRYGRERGLKFTAIEQGNCSASF